MSTLNRLNLMVMALVLFSTACGGSETAGVETEMTPEVDSGTDTDAASDAATEIQLGPIGPHGETIVGPHGGNMIRITAGAFNMGCTARQSASCQDNEKPSVSVTLTHDFYLGETEVTQGQYESVMGDNPSNNSTCGANCPVERVSWTMAAVFANAVSSSAGLTECYTCGRGEEGFACDVAMSPYDCNGYRLPTEAEWEGAARCGEDRLFAGSNDLGAVGWYVNNSEGSMRPVAGKAPNACGIYDMSGNVWEWVQDWSIGSNGAAGGIDPEGAAIGGNRIHRGGSWDSAGGRSRVSHRDSNYPGFIAPDLGFRLVRTVP